MRHADSLALRSKHGRRGNVHPVCGSVYTCCLLDSQKSSAERSAELGSVLMRLVVDLTVCQGYAQCCFLAPEAFQLSGEEALIYDPAPDDAQRERVLRAVAACPVRAIHIQEDGE